METKVINGQPQISPTFGNRIVTYDGLIDFLEMLKKEIPKMGMGNTIAENATFSYVFGNTNELGEKHVERSGNSYIFGEWNKILQNTFKDFYILGSNNQSIRTDGSFDRIYNTYILGNSNTNINNASQVYILGNWNTAQGDSYTEPLVQAYGFGNNLTLTNNAVWLGQYNFKDDDNLKDVIFGIGKGDSDSARSNSLIITKNNVIAISPGADSFSNSANDIKNSIFIASKGIGQGGLSNITNSIFIGQNKEVINSNLKNTVIIGSNAAQGLQNSFLLGTGHRMQIQEAHSGEEEYTPFQVFAFGRDLSVPNTLRQSFYSEQADYPIFLMGTAIYNRETNDQDNWTPYAMVVGNKNKQKNVFTLDYQGSINALSLNVEYLTVSNTAFLPADFALSMKNQLAPVNKRFGYWYTEEGGLLQINKYDQGMPTSGALSIPTIIEFYAGSRQDPTKKATIKADTFNADNEISTNKISADEMSMGIFAYDTTNSTQIKCTAIGNPIFWWARIKYTFDKLEVYHNGSLIKTYDRVTAENCILVATMRTANNTGSSSICSVFQGSSEWATTEYNSNTIEFTGEIKCSASTEEIKFTLQSSTLKCGETGHTFSNKTPSKIEVSIMPFYGHKGE